MVASKALCMTNLSLSVYFLALLIGRNRLTDIGRP